MPLVLIGFALFEFQVEFKTVEHYGLLSMTINQYIKALSSKNGMEYNILVCGRSIVAADFVVFFGRVPITYYVSHKTEADTNVNGQATHKYAAHIR